MTMYCGIYKNYCIVQRPFFLALLLGISMLGFSNVNFYLQLYCKVWTVTHCVCVCNINAPVATDIQETPFVDLIHKFHICTTKAENRLLNIVYAICNVYFPIRFSILCAVHLHFLFSFYKIHYILLSEILANQNNNYFLHKHVT